MLFEVEHVTQYHFSAPVFLEPHVVRLRPRHDGSQTPRNFRLTIRPEPAGTTDCLDAEGNCVTHAWFNGMHDALTISANSVTDTHRVNPFDFLGTDEKLPLKYGKQIDSVLAACSRPATSSPNQPVQEFSVDLCDQVERAITPFLMKRNETLYSDFTVTRREDGPPWPAEETLQKRSGSCRDVTMLFVEACRCVGLAARFVSGSRDGNPDQSDRDLHAWAEVYLPNGGWRRFDPTHGLAVADRHVAVAASAHPEFAAPVTGSYRGTGVTSRITYSLQVRVSEPHRQQQMQEQ